MKIRKHDLQRRKSRQLQLLLTKTLNHQFVGPKETSPFLRSLNLPHQGESTGTIERACKLEDLMGN